MTNLKDSIKGSYSILEKILNNLVERIGVNRIRSSEHEVKVTMDTPKGETVYFIPFESAKDARKYFNDEMDSDDWASIQLLENGEILDQK